MTLLTSIAVPLLMMAQGFTLVVGQKEGGPSKIKTEDIESITFAETGGSDAVEQTKAGITLKLKTGKDVSFLLTDKPIITFEEDQCVIDCKDTKTILNIKDIDFAVMEEPTGIESAKADKMTVDLTDPTAAIIRDLTPGDQVSLYSIDGRLLQKAAAGNDGAATIELTDIARGAICIISVNDTNNFKLIKK